MTASARRTRPRSASSLLNDDPSSSGILEVQGADVIDPSSEDPGVLSLGVQTGSGEARGKAGAKRDDEGGSVANVVGLGSDDGDPADATAKRHVPDDEPLPPGERTFGAYTLLRRLAFGGMGEVFLARRDSNIEASLGVKAPGLARLVVIKRILNHMRRDEKHRRMFIDEARLQTALSSAHIVQVHDVGEIDGQVFLAMEHVHGPSWRALIDRCRRMKQHIAAGHIVEMMIQACDGLSYAHNLVDAGTGSPLRIVHRDINPHNILVTYDGVVKVIDFGIAKSELREQQTETGTIKGKFAYMSPEQSAAEPLDARSDLFAMGICLYELITLTNPFKKGNIVLSLEAIQKLDPKPISALRPGAAFLQPVVERMLRKNPDDRFADCAEVAAALRLLRQDGLVPEPKQPLQIWLRELFAAEIQSHMRVLEATGSAVDVAVSSSVTLSGRPLRPSPQTPAPLPEVPDPASLLPDGHGTGPTGALSLDKRSNRGLYAVAAGVALVVCVAVVVGWQLLRRRGEVPAVVVDAGVAVAAVVDAGSAVAAVVDAGSAVAVVVDAGSDEGSVVDAGVAVAVVDKKKPPPKKDPKETPKKELVVADVVGKVAVSAEGFVVKGPRTVSAKAPTVLVVDDKDAPFKLRLKVVAADDSGATLALESEPWAIVRVDQVGKGKTPVVGVPLVPGKKTTLSLQNPAGASMDVSVTFAARSN